MSQLIPSNIDPNVTSGTQLADIINGFKDAYRTGNSGSSRPANLGAYGYWIDSSTVGTDGLLKYTFYDGTNDIVLFTINKNTQNLILASAENEYEITRISDDSVGPILNLIKKRILGGGQTKDGDNLGRIDFTGVDGSAVTYVCARIRATATDDITSSNQGSKLAFFVTEDETANLIEKMTLTGDGKLGVGTTSPGKTISAAGDDSTVGFKATQTEDSVTAPQVALKKKRQTGTNGQTQNLDGIGTHIFIGTDEAGVEVELAKIEVKANENTSTTAQGSDLIVSVKKKGTTTFEEALKISDGVLSIFGTKFLDSSAEATLQDASTTRNLFSMDSTKYKSFIAEAIIIGRDNAPSTRAQKTVVEGVWDSVLSTWIYRNQTDVMTDTEKVASLSFTNAATLVVDYVNQFVDANFVSGSIFLKVRRFPV